MYVLIASIAIGVGASAQTTFDFESHTLAAESYDNGSSGSGDFIFSGSESLGLSNSYDAGFSYWTGFSISNVTDNTTAGWSNQYSAFTGSGFNGSENYAVFYSFGSLYANDMYTAIESFQITNSTYAAISMRDGDAYGKQFGSVNAANGQPDGTNGEDFFKVWVICSSDFNQTDSIEFYLADYRFSDNSQDYIVDSWEMIDLSSLGFAVTHVDFRFESSDNDPTFGMNTPAYFAIDDVVTKSTLDVPKLAAMNVSVFPNPASDFIQIQGESGDLELFNSLGQSVIQTKHNGTSTISVSNLPAGVYAIRLTNASGSYRNQVIVN